MKEKIDKILSKISFLLEGIFALLLAVFVFSLIFNKYYYGYWSFKYLVLVGICGIITLALMVYSLKKAKGRIENIFLTFIIPVGFFYMIFMLPTYAPDEVVHDWKAYEVSQGYLLPQEGENGAAVGVDVPNTLATASQNYIRTYINLQDKLNEKTDYNETTHLKTAAQSYFFTFYIPAAITFFITRTLNISIIYGMYIAKTLNFILFMLAGYYSIKKIPFGKYIIFTIMFLPMILQQAVSLSADSLINTCAIFYTAYTISLIFQEEKISAKQKILYFIMIMLVSLGKMAYIPLIGLGFILLFSKNMGKRDKAILIGLGTIICVVLVGASYMYAGKLDGPERSSYAIESNIDGGEQIKYILHNPISYLKVLMKTIDVYNQFYIDSCTVSPLGWLNIHMSHQLIIGFLLVLFASIFIEDNEESFSVIQRLWSILPIIGTIVLVITGLYISWTSVGGDIALGIQGRYFIPILPLTLLIFSMKHNYIKIKNVQYILPIILTALNVIVVHQLYLFFR